MEAFRNMLVKLVKLIDENPDAVMFYMEHGDTWDAVAGTRMQYPNNTRECVADGAEPAQSDGVPERREIWISIPKNQTDIIYGVFKKEETE